MCARHWGHTVIGRPRGAAPFATEDSAAPQPWQTRKEERLRAPQTRQVIALESDTSADIPPYPYGADNQANGTLAEGQSEPSF